MYTDDLSYSGDYYIDETDSLCVAPDTKRLASCCFTGHRNIPKDKVTTIVAGLKSTVSYYASKGITNFRAGGALGFDTLAAAVVIDLKRSNPQMRLILDLPYEGQADTWTEDQKRIYQFTKDNADQINFYGDAPTNKKAFSELMFKRNRALVDNSQYCVCYLNKRRGGTLYTVEYAKKHGLEIFNLAEEENLKQYSIFD